MARTSNYALRLLASVKTEAEKVAAAEGTTLNQFINVGVAEKLAALRTAQYFQERVARADLETFDRLLASAASIYGKTQDTYLELIRTFPLRPIRSGTHWKICSLLPRLPERLCRIVKSNRAIMRERGIGTKDV